MKFLSPTQLFLLVWNELHKFQSNRSILSREKGDRRPTEKQKLKIENSWFFTMKSQSKNQNRMLRFFSFRFLVSSVARRYYFGANQRFLWMNDWMYVISSIFHWPTVFRNFAFESFTALNAWTQKLKVDKVLTFLCLRFGTYVGKSLDWKQMTEVAQWSCTNLWGWLYEGRGYNNIGIIYGRRADRGIICIRKSLHWIKKIS